jgi:hypothetical protein
MVVEARRDSYASEYYALTETPEGRTLVDGIELNWQSNLSRQTNGRRDGSWANVVKLRLASVEEVAVHHLLKNDLMKHMYKLKGYTYS